MMEVLCGQCGKALQVADEEAKRGVLCPHCGHEIRPGATGVSPVDSQNQGSADVPPAEPQDEAGFAEQARAAMERKIRVVCGNCGRGLIVPVRMSGKQTQCPACETSIHIPARDDESEILDRLINRNGETEESLAIDEPPAPEAAAKESATPHAAAAPADDSSGPDTLPLPELQQSRRIRRIVLSGLAGLVAILAMAAAVQWLNPRQDVGKPPTVKPSPTSAVTAPHSMGR